MSNSKKRGDAGLGAAIGYFALEGYTVLVPLTDSQSYDLVIEVNDKLSKIQVKTTIAKTRNGNYVVELRTKGGNKHSEKVKHFGELDADYLFVLTGDGDRYLIPAGDCPSARLVLGSKYKMWLLSIGELNGL